MSAIASSGCITLRSSAGFSVALPDPLIARELLKRGDRLIARIADHDVGDDVRVPR
jgi:hypothetical protein